MINFNHHMLVALDIETTGDMVGYHEICQVALVPMTADLEIADIPPFFSNIRPEHEDRAQLAAMRSHGLAWGELRKAPDQAKVSDQLLEWFRDLNMPMDKRLIHLAHNSLFDIPFVLHWLGRSRMDEIFCWIGRDSMHVANTINDRAAYRCEPLPFTHVGLGPMCRKMGIQLDNHHDALADAIATAKLYRELIRLD